MEEMLETLRSFLPILIPLAILLFGLTIASWIHIFTHQNYRIGSRWLWFSISLISIIGPLLYFFIGKEED